MSAKLVTRLGENTKETTKNQSDLGCFTTKLKKMAMVFCKQRFDFVRKATIEKLIKAFQKPKHGKKYVFLAKCIENAVLREKYCQQKWGK